MLPELPEESPDPEDVPDFVSDFVFDVELPESEVVDPDFEPSDDPSPVDSDGLDAPDPLLFEPVRLSVL